MVLLFYIDPNLQAQQYLVNHKLLKRCTKTYELYFNDKKMESFNKSWGV